MILTKSERKELDIDFEIDQKIQSGRLNEILILVPTNRKIRDMKKKIINSSPAKSTGKINLETIGTFAAKLFFNDPEIKGTILSDAASTVLLNQSFQEIKPKYFSNYKDRIPSGTLERIKNVISEYKKHGITPDVLRKESEQLEGSEKLKAEDIAGIYEKYQAKCDQISVKEIGDVYHLLNQFDKAEFEKRFRAFFPDVKLMIVNGFDEFTSPEIEILNTASGLQNLELFLSFDYYFYNPLMFSHLDKCYYKLEGKGFRQVTDSSPALQNKFRAAVREKLFKAKTDEKIGDFKNKIIKFTAQNREKEIELIAKEIKCLLTQGKAEPDKICVAFNLIQKYSPAVRDIFSVYGIPFNLTDRYSLNASPPVIAIINLLEVLENDFYYKNILRALSGGYLDAIGVRKSNLIRVSVELKIISGYKNWVDSIQDALMQKSEEDNEEFSSIAAGSKNEYKKALEDIETINEFLHPFDKKMSPKEFLKNFTELIFKLGIPVKSVTQGGDRVEENVKAITTLIETVTELMELFSLEYKEDEKFSLKFFLNHIRTAVNSTRYNIKERQGYGVQVTNLSEIRGLEFDYLFISGLCDGDFPTRYTPEIFFSPSYVKDEQKHQAEERYHFYQSLSAWNKGLYLTMPLHEEKKEFVESNFLTEFTNLFSVSEKTEKDFDTATAGLFSKEEVLKFIGKNGVENVKKIDTIRNYNLELEPIKEAIEVNDKRINDPFGDSQFTGSIFNDLTEEAKEKLQDYNEKHYSISQLETYAKCPYKYFAERVLKLKPVEEPTEEIEALEMGTLLHSILYEFYSELSKKKIILAGCSTAEFNFAIDLIFKIAEEKIEKVNFHSPVSFFEKEKILGINGNKKNSILFMFLTAEKENRDGFTPQYFEETFHIVTNSGGQFTGRSGKHSPLSDFSVNKINIRGKIDRIDIDSAKNLFRVIDYKSGGKMPVAKDLLDGISLQLPLYMFAAKQLIKAQLSVDFDPASAEIYSLKFSDSDFGRKKIKNSDSKKRNTSEEEYIFANNMLIDICIDSIRKYVQAIVSGKFNLTKLKDRDNKVCNNCGFRSICRIQEVN